MEYDINYFEFDVTCVIHSPLSHYPSIHHECIHQEWVAGLECWAILVHFVRT